MPQLGASPDALLPLHGAFQITWEDPDIAASDWTFARGADEPFAEPYVGGTWTSESRHPSCTAATVGGTMRFEDGEDGLWGGYELHWTDLSAPPVPRVRARFTQSSRVTEALRASAPTGVEVSQVQLRIDGDEARLIPQGYEDTDAALALTGTVTWQ